MLFRGLLFVCVGYSLGKVILDLVGIKGVGRIVIHFNRSSHASSNSGLGGPIYLPLSTILWTIVCFLYSIAALAGAGMSC